MSTEETHTAAEPIVTTKDTGTLEQRQAFLKAFAIAQGLFEPILKNRTVTIKPRDSTQYTFRFADMQEIDAKTRPHLSANGLSLSGVVIPNEDGKGVWLALVLAHELGFERRNEVFVTYGEDIKQFGGRLSYMRRYMKTTILDVTADDDLDDRDDDGSGASGAAAAPPPSQKRTPARRSDNAPAAPAPGPRSEPSGPPDEPPPEGLLTKEELEAQQQRDKARQDAAAAAQQRVVQQAQPPAQAPAEAPKQAPAPTAAPAPGVATVATGVNPDETGELAEPGECLYLVKRARTRGADLRVILDSLGLKTIDEKTLTGIFKSQWKLVLTKV